MLLLAAGALAFARPAQGQGPVVFARSPAGGLIVSSWVDPDGSDADMYAYDEFVLGSDATITEVRWRGGYTQNQFGGPVTNFSITFFESIAGGSQPHLGNPQLEDTAPIYLVKYFVGGNAGESPVGAGMYDYSFALPTPFQATAGVKYWLRIEASQSTYPDWGIAAGSGGDGQYFRFSTGAAMFQFVPGDTAFTLLGSAVATTATFDFDSGMPSLSPGQSTPLDQTSGGVTAHFSSPTAGAGGFSVQSDATTQYHLSQFSSNYLWPNSVYNPALDIQFDQQLTSITFTFATADFQQVEVPTTIKVTAYENSTATPVGSTTAHGTYAGDTMPMGTLSFDSGGQPFNLVEITIPPAPQAASGFLIDNITVTTTTQPPPDTPTPTATPSPAPTSTPAVCVGDCDGSNGVTVNEIIILVNIALGDPQALPCPHGIPAGVQVNVALIIQAVNHALTSCG